MKNFFSVVCALLLLTAVGCGRKVSVPPRGSVAITTEPTGVDIALNGKSLGVAPQKLNGAPGDYLLRFSLNGYRTRWVSVKLQNKEQRKLHVVLPEQGCGVLITSKPDGAKIALNGQAKGTTPLVLPGMMPGKYDLLVSKPGFADRTVPLTVSGVRPQAVQINLVSNVGKLKIETVPKHSRVLIDGKPFGSSPCVAELEAGQHTVRVEHSLKIPYEKTYLVTRDVEEPISIKLLSAPGAIRVGSVPEGAMIYLGGRAVGVTPKVVSNIPAGEVEIAVEKSGFDRVTRKIEISAGAEIEEVFQLLPSTGGMDLAVLPAGVTVYVNGKSYGVVTPRGDGQPGLLSVRNLAPGKYQVTVAHKRAVPERRTAFIKVEKGRVARPAQIELWVPNVEIKWRSNGMVETGMLYAETPEAVVFGSDPGVKIRYERSKIDYMKKLDINE